MNEPGTLYIVSTPIGNLQDITLRALQTLRDVDFILCEDTRHSIKLLNHFEIKKPLLSYHKFNEASTVERIIERLRSGECAALISDAGTPLISDPGYILTEKLIENGLEFVVIPGANALLPALILSGFNTEHFIFIGFLPKKKSKREETLRSIAENPYPSVIYVSPHELKDLLESVGNILPQRKISLSKELTKLHETTFRGFAHEIANRMDEQIKGEFVLVIDAKKQEDQEMPDVGSIKDETLNEKYNEVLKFVPDKKEALKKLAKQMGTSKRVLYERLFINGEKEK